MPAAERTAARWLREGTRVVAATLVERIGSAPLDPGAQMLIGDDGRIEGSVTGGCVEAALVEEAQKIFAGGSAHVAAYGISDEEAAGVGLMCGGAVRVFVHELAPGSVGQLERTAAAIESGEPVAVATLLDGDSAGAKMVIFPEGVLGGLQPAGLLDRSVTREARGFLDKGVSTIRHYGGGGEVMGSELSVYIQAFATRPRMVIFGAIDFSAAMAKLAVEVGYEVTIVDARRPFLESPRFSEAAETVVAWPDDYLAGQRPGPRDAVLVFTHDPKFDEPALLAALAGDAGYIGALGSRRTHEKRLARLREAGALEEDLERIHSPCGLDIGARTPAETSVSILAELIAVRSGRAGISLTKTSGPIHDSATAVG
ncbi:MAG TPA: XdhC/CoxI family protein [Solirubrobacterales bacterium]|nr:XdhC/CoxI family protein [Solirubrobacterales bacterium]